MSQLKHILTSFSTKRRAACRQLQQLTGKLSWAATVVKGGRTYLQRVLDLIRPLQKPHHKAKLTMDFYADIQWWVRCLDSFNRKPIIDYASRTIPIYTDACNQGGGILAPFDWFYVDWKIDTPRLAAEHINIKETMSVVIALQLWAPFLQNSRVIVFTDNTTTRAHINKGACRNPQLMCHLRELFWLAALYNIDIVCKHIPGAQNIYADSISRLHQPGSFLHWYSICTAGTPLDLSHCSAHFQQHMSSAACQLLLSRIKRHCSYLS